MAYKKTTIFHMKNMIWKIIQCQGLAEEDFLDVQWRELDSSQICWTDLHGWETSRTELCPECFPPPFSPFKFPHPPQLAASSNNERAPTPDGPSHTTARAGSVRWRHFGPRLRRGGFGSVRGGLRPKSSASGGRASRAGGFAARGCWRISAQRPVGEWIPAQQREDLGWRGKDC